VQPLYKHPGLPATIVADFDLNTSAKGSNQNAEKVASRYVVVPHTTQQPSKESNWNLQVAVAGSTRGERIPVHSFMDVSHDPP